MVRYCSYCGKHLVSIGDRRRNGRFGKLDWDSREFHSKCYKELAEEGELYAWKKLNFGKYRGLTLDEVYTQEIGYLRWMLTIPKFVDWHPYIRLLLRVGD